MEEYSDEDDEVFVSRNNRNGETSDAARRPLMRKKKVFKVFFQCWTRHRPLLCFRLF